MDRPESEAAAPGWVAARLGRAPGPVLLVTAGLAYLGITQLVMWVNEPFEVGASLWPAAGLTLALLMSVPANRWPWVLGGVALAELAGDLAWGMPLVASLGWVLSNTLEPLVGASLLRRSGNSRGDLAPASPLLKFLAFAVVVGPLVGATIGSVAFGLAGWGTFGEVWPGYFVGDALGVLIIAPVLLTTGRGGGGRSLRELGALGVTSVILVVVVFSDVGGSWMVTMPYLVIPSFVWAAVRLGTAVTAWLALGVTVLANGFTMTGHGPFALASDDPGHAMTLLQVFLAITTSSALLLAALASDLRDRRHLETALRHQATHDPLTGLANRSRLGVELEAACDDGSPLGTSTALLVCDLDGFKAVNDRVGHRGGDQLLVEVAHRLDEGVRPDDLVARISGDEFVVLLRDVDEPALLSVACRVARTVARPVRLDDGRVVRPSISVGAALREAGEGPEALFRAADAALYAAKRSGRGQVVVADADLRGLALSERRNEDELAAAFEEQQIVTVFEPVVALETGEVVAAEALVRWHHPVQGVLDADRFLPAVETLGLGDRLLGTVLDQALRAQVAWATATGREVRVSVDVSAGQLAGGNVVTTVLRALAETGARADALCVEVTKRGPLDEQDAATLRRLHDLGVHVVLAGFGAGRATMSQLVRTPWDYLKIDAAFLADIDREKAAADVVRAMVAMARTLGIRVGAEGVVRDEQAVLLASWGCLVAQGPLFGAPLSASGLADVSSRRASAEGELAV